ncbi:MAG: hypothetical protein P8I91_07655 [Phycisphaerales bacterium]|nr:hypothetical protein [Phycisphaerales bacterium]
MLHSILALAINASLACGSPQACQDTNNQRLRCGSPVTEAQITVADLNGMRVTCNGQPAMLRKMDNNAWAIVSSGKIHGVASLKNTPQGAQLVATGIHATGTKFSHCSSGKQATLSQKCCGGQQPPRAAIQSGSSCNTAG